MNFEKQLSRHSIDASLPHYLEKQKSYVSTIDSEGDAIERLKLSLPIKQRKVKNTTLESSETSKALKKIRKFEDFIGHKYGDQIAEPKLIPDVYDVQNSNESFIKKSMSNPRGHIRFDRYRDQYKTRADRIDPYWGMTLEYEDSPSNPEEKKHRPPKTIDFDKTSDRKPN